MKIIYRNELPVGNYDMIFISLIHQDKNMLEYVINNFKKYVFGNYLLFVHYNGKDDIDENLLPKWVWLSREPITTQRFTISLTIAICKTLKFVLSCVKFTNVFLISSGSAFFREYTIPLIPYIGLLTHESIFNPKGNYLHNSAISTQYSGCVSSYLQSIGGSKWQYEHCDKDVNFLNLVKNRNFKYFYGTQFPGQIWPYQVAKDVVDDFLTLTNNQFYPCEEIYFSTYAYNYAFENNLPINYVEVITNWEYNYNIYDPEYIIQLRNYKINSKEIGHAICKVPENLNCPSRIFLTT
jgi:hypothetical protein